MIKPLRKLHINLDDVAEAMEFDPMLDIRGFLDVETGEVITVGRDELRSVEEIYEEHASLNEEIDFAEMLAQTDYPDWQKELLLLAEQVDSGYGTRYISLPEADSSAAYKDMVAFIATVENQKLHTQLTRAIEGRGAFRRFKDVVERDHRVRQRWFALRDERRRERVRIALEFEGIDAIHVPRTLPEAEPSQPSPRKRLLEGVLRFAIAARQLPGVLRIALIGSLTNDEPDPKDADLLVTIADDMDLEPLATLGRKLGGHAQQFNRGGEVFLVDTRGNYLGRTCRWKQCAPGVRMRCEAQHCGRRSYLYDDLQNVRLRKELIAQPPVELWPEVVAHQTMPGDVQELVLAKLA